MTASPAHRTQGSLVALGDPALEEIKKRYRYTWREDARWIVTTHECCFESDQVTSLEVMQATYTDHEPDSSAQTGQSARQIALPSGEGWLLVESDRRVVLRKTKKQRGKVGLEDFLVDDTRFDVFKNWLGHRYSRPALPDKVSESLWNRGINRGMADLLRERRETYRVLITGHEGADESGDAVIGISLIILLDGSELVGPPYDAEREAWLDKVRSLNWATDTPGDQGVALDEVRFDSAVTCPSPSSPSTEWSTSSSSPTRTRWSARTTPTGTTSRHGICPSGSRPCAIAFHSSGVSRPAG